MSTVVKAKISKLLDRAEDPAETLEYSYQKQIEQLQNVKKGIADVVTAKKRLQLQEEKLQQQVVKLDTQARQALAVGQEDLARQALERKNVAQTELQGLDSQIQQLEQQQDQMTQSEQRLRTKIEQFRSKKEVIKAQYSAAEAQVRISEAATGVGEEMADVGLAMQRALDKTEQMKARANAVQELEAAGTFDDLTTLTPGEDDIDRQLKALSSSSEVDDELAKLKAELGTGGQPAPALAAGSGAGSGEPQLEAPAAPAEAPPAPAEKGPTFVDDVTELERLDRAAVDACEVTDEAAFQASFTKLLEFVRAHGRTFGSDDLAASDLILPPPDVTLEEARAEFSAEGLLPD
jgi:phage shock protein A